MTIYMAQ